MTLNEMLFEGLLRKEEFSDLNHRYRNSKLNTFLATFSKKKVILCDCTKKLSCQAPSLEEQKSGDNPESSS